MNKNSSYIDNYSQRQKNRKELQCRLSMGLRQLKYKPYSIFILLALFILFAIIWENRIKLIPTLLISYAFFPTCKNVISLLLIMAFATSALVIIRQLGVWSSIRIESNLIAAFDANDLKENGYPVLKSLKLDKESNIQIMVFYSHIPLKRWQEKKAVIEEETGMCVKYINYQEGKKKSNYKEVGFIYGKRIKNQKLHDEALDKELKDVN